MRRLRFPLLPRRLRWFGVLLVAIVLVYFSLLVTPPSAPPDQTLGSFWDKKLHFLGYAVFGLSLTYATAMNRASRSRRVVLSIGVAVLFGVLIELLQGPIPNRYFSYADMLANALGAFLATGWFLVESRLEYVRVSR